MKVRWEFEGLSFYTVPKYDWVKIFEIMKCGWNCSWREIQIVLPPLSSQAASFASMASLQLVKWTPARRTVRVCGSDLGSGPGTWPQYVPASDRMPPSPGRGCHRNDRLRRTLGWSWCGNSRCCRRTCGRRNRIRAVNFLCLSAMSRCKIKEI